VTSYPKAPAAKPAAIIADAGRQVTRAHARLDEVESKQSKQTSDISTNAAATATNTTAIATTNTNVTTQTTNLTALDTRLGGSAQETYLGTLRQATAPSNPAHSGIGTISGTPTDTEFNALNTAFNNAVDTIATLLSRLGASNILT
jgi:hypothetical protein